MRRWLVLLGLIACQAQAQTNWFTVTGNPRDASVDTVEVDPVAIRTNGTLKTMNVRVSRARQRTNWEKVPYRSYESRVVFDCRARKAEYLFATFYPTPLWNGPPHKVTDYAANPRPMLFVDVEPNPTNRIIRAACQATG
ncbi:surface-adhesin E family protein [Variovorax sp. GT1P44]|uniref:surface-adhesin E family protein n=1 Tax=Variovorax sp. GT1P44 TaxID=3443742 RepID=UPI003F451D29